MSWVVEVYVRDASDESLKAYFSNKTAGGAAIHELDFTLSRIGGCCELQLVASRERAQGHAVATGDLIEVYVESDDESRDRKYRGMILSLDEDYVDGTVTIGGWGFWSQFEWAIPTQYIEETDVEDVVDAVFDDIKAQTYCETTGNTSLSSSATIGDVEFEFQDAASVIKKLADFQQDVDYGVDEDGTFFFLDKSTTKRGHFQVGLNVAEMRIKESMEDLCNDVLIRTKGTMSNGSLILHEDDSASISSYKKRTRVIDAPEFEDLDDAVTYGENDVSDNKAPVKVYDFTPILSSEKMIPYRGTVTVVDEDGATLVSAADIESVRYIFDGKGFTQRLEIGDSRANKSAGKMLAELDRKVLALKTSEISLSKIDHSGFDEFQQYVRKNALAADKYNIISCDMANVGKGSVKLIDSWGNSELARLTANTMNPFSWRGRFVEEPEAATFQTVPIPAGRSVDSVRIYYHMDQWGRYNFSSEDALQDWYNTSCSDTAEGGYVIEFDDTYETYDLVGNPNLSEANRGNLRLAPTNWSKEHIARSSSANAERVYYQQPDDGYIRFRIIADSPSGVTPFIVRFNYNRSSNNYARFQIGKSAGGTTFRLDAFFAGISTDFDTGTDAASIAVYIVKLKIDDTNGEAVAYIYNAHTDALIDTLTVTMAAQSDKIVHISRMEHSDSADTGDAKLRWWDFPLEDGGTERVTFKVSRDGGTTWTSTTPSHITTYSYADLDISGQPAGDKTLILKCESKWPALVYGIGMAWGGD